MSGTRATKTGLYQTHLGRTARTARVPEGSDAVGRTKDRLLPLLEYIDRFAPYHREVVIFDKIMGRAAALLCVKASCQELYSPLGSQLAIEALDKYGIKYHLTQIAPYIQKPDQKDMCPMERLSLDKAPEEFYEAIRNIVNKAQAEDCGTN
ncbi:MAG: DUF1893 domain-containing protein [Dehalococcoidia bacterium]|nr:DUF1893 domain-containing protein [Dehalococcoidia bacterium]